MGKGENMQTNHARKWEVPYTSHVQSKEKQLKVRKTGWITKGEKILYTFTGVCLIVAALYIVSFSSITDSINRDIQSLEQQIQAQKVENESLFFEKKELSRPERITRIAKENGLTIQNAEVRQASSFGN